MGKGKKPQPLLLPAKLRAIRQYLNLTQEQMFKYVVPDTEDAARERAALSDYESGRRSPSPLEVFYYAKAVRTLTVYKNFSSDDLTDDARSLPFSSFGEDTAAGTQRGVTQLRQQKKRERAEQNQNSSSVMTFNNPTDSLQAILNDNSETGSLIKVTSEENDSGDDIEYQRSFYFSREFSKNFDDFAMRLLLATPYGFREHYSDSSVSVEIAVLAALRDLERMERENTPSIVAESLRQHIADHYEN